jgi:hypothetical protein
VFRREVILAVQAFDQFTEANVPHGEHDFGSIEILSERVIWKNGLLRTFARGRSPAHIYINRTGAASANSQSGWAGVDLGISTAELAPS